MRIYDCRINHRIDPIGYEMHRVVASWKVDEAKGTAQNAARLRVSSDDKMQEIIYDSGWDEKLSSIGTVIPMELRGMSRYYWQVSVLSNAAEEERADSQIHFFETSKMEEPWIGKWISCDSKEKRHPIFTKNITPTGQVVRARLYICGLGLYEASYNGKRIGEEYLTPYSNNYNRWLQYQTYDVTEELQKAGTLSVMLGNGWYKARFGFSATEDVGFYGDEWKLMAELHLLYQDGRKDIIGSDDSWQVLRSNIIFSNLYDGEQVDDTLEAMPAVCAKIVEPPKGQLIPRLSTPVTVHETFIPKELLLTPKGEQVLDMGQEFAGTFTLKVHVPRGTRVHIQTGEILQQGNFYNENLRTAKSEYVYISDGEAHVLQPHFTYYGYRYVKITGIENLKKDDFTGYAFYSQITPTGTMRTGHPLVNQLLSNVMWGLKSNFIDVPTDCPQRDERMGWTGDAQVFSRTACYLEDCYAFYEKYLRDLWEEQQDFHGMVPDVVPSCGVDTVATVWGDAACIIPWNLYTIYGDQSILLDQYDSMRGWVDYITSVDGENHAWGRAFHYGDWLALDKPSASVDEVLGGTDEAFIANLYYGISAGIVADAAAVLHHEDDEKKYRTIYDQQMKLVKEEYYSPTGRCCINTQTALLLTLQYHLSENEELTIAMLRKLFADNEGRLKTGFVGTPLLGNVLSDNGCSDLAYALLLNRQAPSWLHEIELGATTVWERWNSVNEDGSISSTGMNSLNHYSAGSIVEWMYGHILGIRQKVGEQGYLRAMIAPEISWELQSASGSYDSAAGRYEVHWEMKDANHVSMMVKVPFNCEADIILPHGTDQVYKDSSNPLFANVVDGICHVKSGTYHVSYETDEMLKRIITIDTPAREVYGIEPIRAWLESEGIPYRDIPVQYRAYSFRGIREVFGGNFKKLDYDRLDQGLREISGDM